MKHIIKPHLWETMWSARQAVHYLLLDGKQMRQAEELAISIEADNAGWIKAQKGLLKQDEVLREVVPHLSHVLSRLGDQMREYKLPDNFSWPPALWLRSFEALDFPLQPHALVELKRWQSFNENEGKHFLYKYRETETGNFIGPMHARTDKLGRTALELAVGKLPEKIALKAHALKWKMEVHTIRIKKKDIQLVTYDKVKLFDKRQPPRNEVKTEKDGVSKPSKSGKRRNINTLRMRYGQGCVKAVQAALEDYVECTGSSITNCSPDSRPYSSSVSKLELMEFLQGKYKEVGRYSVSTLKPVLGHFVQTPRGRPPTLAELSEREFQVAKKVQRKSR